MQKKNQNKKNCIQVCVDCSVGRCTTQDNFNWSLIQKNKTYLLCKNIINSYVHNTKTLIYSCFFYSICLIRLTRTSS